MKRNNTKTLTICGSMRFEEQMQRITLDLEINHSFNILQCTYNPQKSALTPTEIQRITAAHYKKIDMSDGIYVVDINGYIGQSVKAEINYAIANGKEIFYHSKFMK